MNDKTPKNDKSTIIWIARYTTIGQYDKIRRQEVVVYADSEPRAWEEADKTLRASGMRDFKINNVKRFL